MKIIQISQCQDCKQKLKDHPSLEISRVLERRLSKKSGRWLHTTKAGKMLHIWNRDKLCKNKRIKVWH